MSGQTRKELLVVAGPTATGKTRLGIALARRYGGEIVSADSMQVYRRMDIGTAKASPRERAEAPHHMLDVAEPWESYSVSRYVQQAAACCDDILRRGKLPLVVGGTGLYIDSLLDSRDFAGTDPRGAALREALGAEYDRLGGEAMLAALATFDPERAARLHPADKRRIIRAIEVYRLTGKSISQHDAETRALPPRYRAGKVILSYRDRNRLYTQIDQRVDAMVDAGLFDEVALLLEQGLSADCTSMQAIGYKEAALALAGTLSRQEAVAQIKQNSRRYAKRQLTWFKRDPDALWIFWDQEPDFDRALDEIHRRFFSD